MRPWPFSTVVFVTSSSGHADHHGHHGGLDHRLDWVQVDQAGPPIIYKNANMGRRRWRRAFPYTFTSRRPDAPARLGPLGVELALGERFRLDARAGSRSPLRSSA